MEGKQLSKPRFCERKSACWPLTWKQHAVSSVLLPGLQQQAGQTWLWRISMMPWNTRLGAKTILGYHSFQTLCVTPGGSRIYM